MSRTRGSNKKTRHHQLIIPRSRGGRDSKDNIAMVTNNLHQKYHFIFDNKLPTEILDFLVEYFWKGDIGYIYQYLDRRKRR